MLSNIRKTTINGNIYYFLSDISKMMKFKSYVPKKLLKNIPETEVTKAFRPNDCKKYFCITEKGLKLLLADKGFDLNKKQLNLKEKVTLARKYRVSEGFITAHLYAGDLEEQLEYRRKHLGIEDEVKSYNCRDFTKKTIW